MRKVDFPETLPVIWPGPQPTLVHFRFSRTDCAACPVRTHCTQSATLPRSVTIYARPAFDALQTARRRQRTEAFWQQYAPRAGIEGTAVHRAGQDPSAAPVYGVGAERAAHRRLVRRRQPPHHRPVPLCGVGAGQRLITTGGAAPGRRQLRQRGDQRRDHSARRHPQRRPVIGLGDGVCLPPR